MIISRRFFLCVVFTMVLATCQVDPYVVVESANQNSRVNMLVIHATSENFAESLRLLTVPTNNPVSSHYLVPAENDDTYLSDTLRIHALVPEHRRAWHAGVSQWGSETGLNDRSIGIEVVNEFKCAAAVGDFDFANPSNLNCVFPAYTDDQVQLLIMLIKDILRRYPDIDPINIVAHSDIAPERKSDPGPLFPWHTLYTHGIGAWPDQVDVDYFSLEFARAMPSVGAAQRALSVLGFGIEVTGEYNSSFAFALRAFQLHFRPANYSGELDGETAAILWALLKKYRARQAKEFGSELVFS